MNLPGSEKRVARGEEKAQGGGDLNEEDQVEVQRRQQGALEREERARHAAEKLAKVPAQAQQPVQ